MLEQCKDAQERWGGVHQMIDKWLNDRQALIVRFCNLSASRPLSDETPLGQKAIRVMPQVMNDIPTVMLPHMEAFQASFPVKLKARLAEAGYE